MGSKKRPASTSVEVESDAAAAVANADVSMAEQSKRDGIFEEKTGAEAPSMAPMERQKKRKALDKERHHLDAVQKKQSKADMPTLKGEMVTTVSSTASAPGLHVNIFGDLASADSLVREAAAEALVVELSEVQKVYEKQRQKGANEGAVQLEAEKDDGLEDCAPSLRYALRRLIRGVSSSRECARQGFALGLTAIITAIPTIKIDSMIKLIVNLLEVSSSMRGQETKDCLLGRLFAYGSLARSQRITKEWIPNSGTSVLKDFVSHVISLAGKKRYLSEPAVFVILQMVDKVASEALLTEIINAPGVHEWFDGAAVIGDPNALYLALKLHERVHVDDKIFGKLLPYPFSPNNFFSRDHLSYLAPCLKESTFCQPRLHSIWPLVVKLLLPEISTKDEDAPARLTSGKKQKKFWKGSSFEDLSKNVKSFHEVVIEGSLLASSHDRKHLAFSVLLLMLPRLPVTCVQIVLSNKLVHCLMDVLSNQDSWLYNAAQHFLKELVNLDGDDRRVAIIISLQKHSSGRFDSITRTHAVKELVAKLTTVSGCLLFVQNLISLFVDEVAITDEPSDQSQTTDENSELGSSDDKGSPASGNTDFLKHWVIDTMPRCLKSLKLDPDAKSWSPTKIAGYVESKFRVQTEILKFLAVQGLFSASLGTEVTSFELQEKFKWPKTATSSSLRRMCIEQLQWLLEDAQRGESLPILSGIELNDLGSYFMCFLNTLSNIPSVSLYRILSSEDEKAREKLTAMESRLSQEERKTGAGMDTNKLHALRYLLIQLLLQVLGHQEFSEAAFELVICCKKAFPSTSQGDSSEEEEYDGNDVPELMDVLVDTLLSLLPQSSGPLCFAVEQVFRFFCDTITDAGLLQMLRVVKKNLKPPRHQVASVDADDDEDVEEEEDFLGIEEAEETDEVVTLDSGDNDGHTDDSEEKFGVEVTDDGDSKQVVDSEGMDGDEGIEVDRNDDSSSASDDSDSGMDDDAMFRMDSYIARIFKERKISGSDSALAQLLPFKLRVLSLLEIYLHRNPGKPQVLMVYFHLTQVFVKSHAAEGSEQLRQRIGAILQKKVFKAKEYPRGNGIELSSLQVLLEKSLKSASRWRFKSVASLAETSTFWLLKIIHSRNFTNSELEGVVDVFRNVLTDYFSNKKSRLKPGFLKEVVRRYPWVGLHLFGFLMENCGSAKSEFRRIEALDCIDCVIRSCILISKGEKEEGSSKSKLLKKYLPTLCELIQHLLNKLPEKQSRRSEVRRFCTRALHTVSKLNLKKSFLKALNPNAYSLCESQLGETFISFKTST